MDDIMVRLLIVVLVIVGILLVAAYLSSHKSDYSMDIGGQTPRASGGSDTSSEKGFKTRISGMGIFSAGVFAVLLAKLWSMQLVSADEYAAEAKSNLTRTITTSAPRGRILDCNGTEIVTNRSSRTVVAKKDVADDAIECRLLANLLGMPYVAVKHKIEDESEGAQNDRTVATDVDADTVAYLDEHSYLFDGVSVEERTQRSYPYDTMACQVLGYTGSVTQDMLDEQEDSEDAISYELGDTVGQAGIEYQYESVLQGIKGEQTVYVDANGDVTDYSTTIDPQAGSDVVLTIDATIQQAAESGLQHAIEMAKSYGHETCQCSAIVVLDATDGSVLAMASTPTYSPSMFIGGISNDDWNNLSSEDAGDPLMNRAVAGQYMSASTIKPLSTLAALDYGIADSSTSYYCSGYWTGFGEDYGQYCWNHNGHGYMNLENGIIYSCDSVFYEIGKAFYYSDDSEGLQKTFRKWGLGSVTGIDLPGEAEGRVPDAEWKWNYFSSYSDDERTWQGGDMTNLAIGQGDLLVTPLQMCCAYMGIANRGTIWKPHLLKEIRSQDGSGSVVAYEPTKLYEIDEASSSFDLIQEALSGVIYQESAAIASHFTNLSVKVAGKTGTGEKANDEPTSWFCAYAPSDDPKYVIAATIERGGYGAESALYAVRDVLGGIYGEPDTSSTSTNSDTTR
jgi:penicillin-binding protein 2